MLVPWLLLSAGCSDYAYAPNKGDPDEGENCTEGLDAPDVPKDEACTNEPLIGTFTPVIEWQWNTNTVDAGYDDIMATPAVANLDDDNGDHQIDENDVPDVVFTAFAGGAYTSAGALVAVEGDGSGQLWSTLAPGGYTLYSSASPAIGDLDADGRPEICTAGVDVAVVCVNNDGSLKWAAGTEASYVGAPAIADLDGDGYAEVVLGRQVFDHTGVLVGIGSGGRGLAGFSFPADMDGDGALEVVVGNGVFGRDGAEVWSSTVVADGIPAVGDFDGDEVPEIVSVSGGIVSLFDEAGVRWQVAVPGGGSGGPPTVADFDGDGLAEVGVAGLAYYSVIDTDGVVLWSNAVSDYSSSVTGSSVFDFEADGAAEVVYADEHTLWVFDGATGAVKLEEGGHASGTLYEYPVIADVDGDGHTEIVVASNNYAFDGWNGITVVGDADSSWADSRPIWNEFAYHITNINEDGSVPTAEAPNWASWNNFRAGGVDLGPSHWLADLHVVDSMVCVFDCFEDSVDVSVAIGNSGLQDAVSVDVQIVRSDGAVVWEEVAPVVAAGTSVVLGPVTLGRVDWRGGDLRVVLDAAGGTDECDETDNEADLGVWPCE